MKDPNDSRSVRLRTIETFRRGLSAKDRRWLSNQLRAHAEACRDGRRTKRITALRRAQLFSADVRSMIEEACSLEPAELVLLAKEIRLEP